MKGFATVIVLLFTGIFVLLGLGYFWFNSNTKALTETENLQAFVVPRGRSASEVGAMLYQAELIRSPLAFKIYVQVFGKSDSINAGEFSLSPNMSVSEIVENLGGGALELWVTIPEGFRREEIADRFVESLKMPIDQQSKFRSEFLSLTQDKEGYLFPDTYLFPKEASASAAVKRLNTTFNSKADSDLKNIIQSSIYSLDQIINMASIIERETITDEERPVVAGVLWNRYEIGMALQADATVQYASGSQRCTGKINCDWWQVPTGVDLKIDSPYNTYKYSGLPPTPIANPGISSIKAAANPQDTDYFYYIHDPSGQIYFARTLDEHKANVSKYLNK
jgi:UPF0755 protein